MRILIFGLVILSAWQSAFAGGRFYKWIDKDGVVHYGDYVPPQNSQQERATLNKYGSIVDVIPPAKTKEQLEEEEKRNQIQEEDNRKKMEQSTHDRILVHSYASEKDIDIACGKKTILIARPLGFAKKELDGFKKSLLDLENKKEGHIRAPEPVPISLEKEIQETRELIAQKESYISSREEELEVIRVQFRSDLKRFRELVRDGEIVLATRNNAGVPISEEMGCFSTSVAKEPLVRPPTEGVEKGEANCQGIQNCSRAWDRTLKYITAKSGKRPQIINDNIIATDDPRKPNEVGLSVSRKEGTGTMILDIFCHKSDAGTKYCQSPEVQAIRKEFKEYVEIQTPE
ncbi:hypothetical protein CCP3SC1AL1_1470003 [Gammaproteobacteria bacterium]